MSKATDREREQGIARIELRRMLGMKPAKSSDKRPRVYTMFRKRGTVRSGPCAGWPKAWVSVFIVRDGQIVNVTGIVGRALDYRHDSKWGGLVCVGGNSDPAYDIVVNLSYALYGVPSGPYNFRHEAL